MPSESVNETWQEREGTDSSIGEDKANNAAIGNRCDLAIL